MLSVVNVEIINDFECADLNKFLNNLQTTYKVDKRVNKNKGIQIQNYWLGIISTICDGNAFERSIMASIINDPSRSSKPVKKRATTVILFHHK